MIFVVQETLKSLLQHHNLKASILQFSAFFMVQLSHPYMITGKNHSFDCMDLCQPSDVSDFNTLSRFVIAFLNRASFNFMAAVTICSDFKAQENKVSLFPFFPYLLAMK